MIAITESDVGRKFLNKKGFKSEIVGVYSDSIRIKYPGTKHSFSVPMKNIDDFFKVCFKEWIED